MKIDKKLLVNNIRFLSKYHNIKMGDLETKVEVSLGYFSRISADDNLTMPSIEIIYSVASLLKVSIDSLLTFDYSSVNATEIYLITFFNKLMVETQNGNIFWKKDGKEQILERDKNEEFIHPMIETKYDPYSRMNYSNYLSKADLCFELQIPDMIYRFSIFKDDYYLLKTKGIDDLNDIYEMYLYKNKKRQLVCSTMYSTEYLKKVFADLYKIASEDVKKTKLSNDVKESIDLFMLDLPF